MKEQDLVKIDNLLNIRLIEKCSDDLGSRIILEAEKIDQKKSLLSGSEEDGVDSNAAKFKINNEILLN